MGQLPVLLAITLVLPAAFRAQAATIPPGSPAVAAASFWKALSSDAGHAPDVVRLRELFHPDAVVFGARDRAGSPAISATRAADFVASQDRVRPKGFYECEVVRTVKEVGRFATVYSVVESRTNKAAARADFVGVNSFQMYKEQHGWKILSLYYYVGSETPPVPLEGGTSGACLPAD